MLPPPPTVTTTTVIFKGEEFKANAAYVTRPCLKKANKTEHLGGDTSQILFLSAPSAPTGYEAVLWPGGRGSRAAAAGRGSVLTCSWMRSLLGPRVKLVEKSTAHFSSVTDSVPFRSQRLIFFRSCQGGEKGEEGRTGGQRC